MSIAEVKSWSLKRRMFLAIALILLIAFSLIFWSTRSAYIIAGKSRIQESLTAQIYALMAVADDQNALLSLPNPLKNDRLNHLNSGLVAYVLDSGGGVVWRSPSSEDFTALPNSHENYSLSRLLELPLNEQDFFWVGDRIIWEFESGEEIEYWFLIGEQKAIFEKSVSQYQNQLVFWLSLTALCLIMVMLMALERGLRPLRDAQQQIEKVRLGEIEAIHGRFPTELNPLTESINLLLLSEKLQKIRYRDSLGNLAHSLKTPLAVLKSELQHYPPSPSRDELVKQVSRIDDIVRYQLNRSVVTHSQLLRKRIPLAGEVDKIIAALLKVHATQALSIESVVSPDSYFPGEAGDLMELVGNLADNACKWAQSKVVIGGYCQQGFLVLQVDDDGPGIPVESRTQVLDRGKRLDQKTEGQGLGLAIVMDIVKNYRGEISIENSALGGSCFILKLPLT